MNFSGKKLIFVTGKGGVGKSLLAASIAYREAKKGRRVCLTELGGQSFYESFFETRGIGYDPIEIMQNFHISILTPDQSLREYVTYYIKVPKLYDLFFQNRVTKAFLNACPGVNEISILGKLTSDIRHVGPQSDYDLYVVDCYSTGHALALFRAPRAIATAVTMGPMGEQTRQIAEILKSPEHLSYVLVTLAEEMPINETIELHEALKGEFSADITTVCNRLLFPPLNREEQSELLRDSRTPTGLKDFMTYLVFKLERQDQARQRLSQTMGNVYGVPLLLGHQRALSAEDKLEMAASHLETPWVSMS